jgi:alkylated DNA repair dioxygenase AlkB
VAVNPAMQQLGFFGEAARTLVDDETGCISYVPRFLSEREARAAFERLRSGADWHSQRRWMYEREVDVPRLTASYRAGDAMPQPLAEFLERVSAHAGAPFNAVGLNLYRDERDSVAPHNDHLYELAEGQPIALISLGDGRVMTIRSKQRPRRVFDVELEPGSLLMMSYETQRTYDHGIPKQRKKAGPRMSVVFRVRPQLSSSDHALSSRA